MRASTAYFAGAGTVIAAIVGGIGGGLLFADMISPKSPKQELTRLEQRMSSQPIQVKAEPSEPAPNPAAPPPSTTAAAPTVPAPPPAQTEAQHRAGCRATGWTRRRPPARRSRCPIRSSGVTAGRAAKQAAAAPEDSLAKAKDVDIKRAADRQATQRAAPAMVREAAHAAAAGPKELREVEEKVREETETRPIFASEPVRTEMPRIRLFDLD